MSVYIDSFSGCVAELLPKNRTPEHVMHVLAKHPRVSVWDMSELAWLRKIIERLVADNFLVDDKKEQYPWIRYLLTDKGKAKIAGFRP